MAVHFRIPPGPGTCCRNEPLCAAAGIPHIQAHPRLCPRQPALAATPGLQNAAVLVLQMRPPALLQHVDLSQVALPLRFLIQLGAVVGVVGAVLV